MLQDVRSVAKGEERAVVLSKDLPAFTYIVQTIVPYLTDRKDFALLVQHDKVPGLDLNDVCEHHIDTLVKAANESPSVMVGDISYEPEVDTIDIPEQFEVKQASEVSNHVLLVTFEFTAFVSYTFFIPRAELYLLSEEEQGSIGVLDPDWNEGND